ncbi:MAG: ATP-dependent Clp protease proteolytic subunit [Verrucomicrobiae bacterium]|nr:ATP-dependent Clp protease proteolytic subunit [Verrucomicrobiae bacterium]
MKALAIVGAVSVWFSAGTLGWANNATNTVCVIQVHEDITHNTVFLIRRGLQEAHKASAAGIVIDLDTNGGLVNQTEKVMRLLERSPRPTVTFVNGKAYSAGAFIAAATDRIYMAPGSVIGAATPIMLVPGSGPAEMPKALEEKLSSAVRAMVRSTAQMKGHNPDVFEAMVDADRELVLDGKVISEKGKLLTLTNEEAARPYGDPPKPLLSLGTVANVTALLASNGWAGATVLEIKPTGFEVVGRWLTMIGPLLMLIGFVAIYLEMKTPGIGVPTVVAVIAFSLYFIGNFIAGLAGMEEIVIFIIGVLLLLIEVFVLPGFGVAGFLGVCAILIALILGMTERFPGGPPVPTLPDLKVPILTVAWTFIGSVFVMVLLGRFLPKTSVFRKMELAAATAAEQGYVAAAAVPRPAPGSVGVAETVLRPAGKARFDGQLVDVVSTGDMIEKGAAVRVVEVHGSKVVVTTA